MAKANAGNNDVILCPCNKCRNLSHQKCDIVYEHLVIEGMDPNYSTVTWFLHGETLCAAVSEDKVKNLEAYEMFRDVYFEDNDFAQPANDSKGREFTQSLEDADTPLYPGCTSYTKLSAVCSLYKHKAAHGESDQSFDELLRIVSDMLPKDNALVTSMYSAKKLLKSFDLGYEKIHACVNNCCLFRKDLKLLESCPKCGFSRWQVDKRTKKIKKGIPAKVLRYFPIIPRFKRMSRLREKAEQLRWHFTHKSQDGKMHHPVDSLAWDSIDRKWPSFASDPRNLRLALATDGFNPFSNLSSRYSCWPVMLVTYNLPPWLCMAKENLMLTLLIPGPKQPGNDIDVFLQPLIEDLNELWTNGVGAYDAASDSVFNLKAILMWTINDFPAYGNLAGCVTKGKFACPTCSTGTCSQWLSNSRKTVYMGHRRFLAPDHPFRTNNVWFDGNHELRGRPKPLSGSDVLNAIKDIVNNFGKVVKQNRKGRGKKRKKPHAEEEQKEPDPVQTWKKKSIFFDLPYWDALLLRHNLDVMHIEKNVCDSLISTLLNVKGKSKDGLRARRDLAEMDIRHGLHAEVRGSSFFLPPGPHNLSKKEKETFCSRLHDLKLPDGYSSNIANCVSLEECKLLGLKSHDCHILMQQLLSVALRGLLKNGPRNAIFRLCYFFNQLCQRVIDRNKLEQLEVDIAETLCMLERYFPPSFFDVMVHLTIHLGREARICGPVQFRWMYPFERYMKVLKGYVRNRARPEGCIAECYLADECMQFCTTYMKQTAEIGARHNRNEDFENDTSLEGRPISLGKSIQLPDDILQIAHRCVLINTEEVQPYLEMHAEELKLSEKRLARNAALLHSRQMDTFCEWLKEKIKSCESEVSDTLKWIAAGPRKGAMSYSGYIINGLRFHTSDVQRTTQNSGVFFEAETLCRSSRKDAAQVVEQICFYGVIRDVILLDYYNVQVPLFRCDWATTRNGVKFEDGFTLVNLKQGRNQLQRDPFILASQAKQVFYARDNDTSNWEVVLKAPLRGFQYSDMNNEDAYMPSSTVDVAGLDTSTNDEDESYVRTDCEGEEVDGDE